MDNINNSPVSLQYTNIIQEICRPLFENTRIKHFSHCVLNENNQLSGLCSHPSFTEFYVGNKYYNFSIELLKSVNSSRSIFSDFINLNGKTLELHTDAAQFGFGHFFTIVKVHHNIKESFHFAGAIDDDEVNNFYIQHRDSLENFILYYKDRVQSNPLLRQVFDEIWIADSEENEHYLDFNITPKPTLYLNTDKYVVGINQAVLSKREIECLYWLTHGKTLEEVASLLTISRRTVKAHVENVKAKLKCETLFQLGQAYQSLELWRLLSKNDVR